MLEEPCSRARRDLAGIGVADADELRDLRERVAVPVLEHDDGPVTRRQVRHQLVQLQATAPGRRGPGEGEDREQLLQAAPAALDPEAPVDTRAEQLTDPHIGKDGFLDLFGRPPRESSCECERRSDLSLPQALNLVNGKTISEAVADAGGRIAKAILGGRGDRELIEELYLASLSRPASAAEIEKGLEYLRGGQSRAARAQDMLWALLNSKAFLYNY